MRPLAVLLALLAAACSAEDPRPNVLWIVWDTVRADHLGLYGYERDTTPHLDRWAEGALVFEDCLAAGSSTVPSHGSMFTGLLPTEHGASFATQHLADRFDTVAEVLQRGGYRTYLFSANPNIQSSENFAQGFDEEDHPWDPELRDRALAILSAKVAGRDKATGLQSQLRTGRIADHELRACGALAREGLLSFLSRTDDDEPYFAFLNYMEAHAPLVPPEVYRRRFLDEAGVRESYEQDRSWANKWSYTYGFRELPEEWFHVYRATYDAALAELDDLLRELLTGLEAAGQLDNTLIVFTSDHGEHLGDHGLVDHRHSVYQSLVHVPLVLAGPGIEPGRTAVPASGVDLYRTVLAATGHADAGEEAPRSLDLVELARVGAAPDRERLSEYPDDFPVPTRDVYFMENGTDLSAWRRELRALVRGRYKRIAGSDGSRELYDLAADPLEESDLAGEEPRLGAELDRALEAWVETMEPFRPDAAPPADPALREQLESMGYLEPTPGDS